MLGWEAGRLEGYIRGCEGPSALHSNFDCPPPVTSFFPVVELVGARRLMRNELVVRVRCNQQRLPTRRVQFDFSTQTPPDCLLHLLLHSIARDRHTRLAATSARGDGQPRPTTANHISCIDAVSWAARPVREGFFLRLFVGAPADMLGLMKGVFAQALGVELETRVAYYISSSGY